MPNRTPKVNRIFIKSNGKDKEYGKQIIKYLESIGGDNCNFMDGNTLGYYFIDYTNKAIRFTDNINRGKLCRGYMELDLKSILTPAKPPVNSKSEQALPWTSLHQLRNVVFENKDNEQFYATSLSKTTVTINNYRYDMDSLLENFTITLF